MDDDSIRWRAEFYFRMSRFFIRDHQYLFSERNKAVLQANKIISQGN